jgi:hypothetical protein
MEDSPLIIIKHTFLSCCFAVELITGTQYQLHGPDVGAVLWLSGAALGSL